MSISAPLSELHLERVLETSLYADDLEAAERFYRDDLGLPLIGREAGRHAFFGCGGSIFLLFRPAATRHSQAVPPHGAAGPGHVAFAVEEGSLEAWRCRLEQRRIEIESDQRWPGGGRSLYLRDPAGNSVELTTPGIWAEALRRAGHGAEIRMGVGPDIFYAWLSRTMNLPPTERHAALVRVHTGLLQEYRTCLSRIDEAAAGAIMPEGRRRAQIVGHFAAWDRYVLQAMGEILSGCESPRIMRLKGFLEPGGGASDFASVDAFNAAQAGEMAAWSWDAVRHLAEICAVRLWGLLAASELSMAEACEATRWHTWLLPTGQRLELRVGWYLWGVTLEHLAIEHTPDLALS
jgi:catechol 2,3-dioxygenase-like lactoylglutathione lyase family enzyme